MNNSIFLAGAAGAIGSALVPLLHVAEDDGEVSSEKAKPELGWNAAMRLNAPPA